MQRAASEAPLDRLTAAISTAAELRAEADSAVDHYVASARQSGHSWTEIGDRLGVSKQAARERFSDQVLTSGRERFTPRLRRSVSRAADLAQADGCTSVDTLHLLLALATSEGIAALALEGVGLNLVRLEAAARASRPGTGHPAAAAPPETPQLVEALHAASSLALHQGHHYVGTEHVLFVLAGDQGSITHRLLTQLGVNFADLKRELEKSLSARAKPVTKGRRRKSECRCSFCGRGETGTRLVAGPGVFICRDCARLAIEVSTSG